MPNDPVLSIDHGEELDVNIVSKSPHVVAYRLWRQLPQGQWQVCGEGHTADDIADHNLLTPLPEGARFAYWLGIGGNPNTQYRALVTIAQGGQIVDGGSFLEEGVANAQGVAEAHAIIAFN